MADVRAEMSGVLSAWKVSVGERVSAGQEIGLMESMKMEIPITAPQDGAVSSLSANPGDFVQEGDTIAVIDA